MRRALIALMCAGALAPVILAGATTHVSGPARFRQTQVRYAAHADGGEVWQVRVYTLRGHFVGQGILSCERVDMVSSVRQCSGTYTLPLGQIAIFGTLTSRGSFTLLIVGGSEAYLGAKGTVIARRYGRNPPQSFVTFYLV